MRTFRFLQLAVLSVMVGSAALVYAQDEKQEDKPAKQEETKPQPKQEEGKPARPEEAKPKQDNQMQKQDEKRGQEQSHEQAAPERQEHPQMQGDRAPQGQEHPEMQNGNRAPEQHAQNGRPAGGGGHIPDDKFRSHFGHDHHFRASTVIVAGRPQFAYGGYNFQLVDAWPADWAYTDDCYIDFIDGEYFLFDLMHPGIRIAVFVVM
jgi:hypothetical protein